MRKIERLLAEHEKKRRVLEDEAADVAERRSELGKGEVFWTGADGVVARISGTGEENNFGDKLLIAFGDDTDKYLANGGVVLSVKDIVSFAKFLLDACEEEEVEE